MKWKWIFSVLLIHVSISTAFFPGSPENVTRDIERIIYSAATGGQEYVDFKTLLLESNIDLPEISEKCKKDISTYVKALDVQNNPLGVKPWALKMFDATGKSIPPSSLQGALIYQMGNVGSCMEVDSGSFVGRYFKGGFYDPASIEDGFALTSALTSGTKSSNNLIERIFQITAKPNLRVNDLMEFIGKTGNSTAFIGLCLPDSCSLDHINIFFYLNLPNYDVVTTGIYVRDYEDKNVEIKWRSEDYVTVTILSVLFLLIGIGTIIDVAMRHGADQVIPVRLVVHFQGFSVYTVVKRVFQTRPNKEGLNSINGIRFFSMVWVIVGHSYMIVTGLPSMNAAATLEWMSQPGFRIILNATQSVDSFFMIGGILLSYLTLKEVTKQRGGSFTFWIMYYVHRYIRLTGPLAGVVMIYGSLVKFLPYIQEKWDVSACAEMGWRNILYSNNYGNANSCMGQTWYLAVEMQCFIITPILIFGMYKFPRIGSIFTGILVVISTVLRFLIYDKQWEHPEEVDNFQDIYIKPWYRFGAYGVGLIYGSILFHTREKEFKGHITGVLMTLGWIISLVTIFLITYGYDQTAIEEAYPDRKTEFMAYYGLFRNCWAIALGFIVFASAKGYGGPIGSFLAWSAFEPLAKMTYGAYLIHGITMYYFFVNISYRIAISHALVAFIAISNVWISMALGLLVIIVFEAPVAQMEKLVFGHLGLSKLPTVIKYKTE